ncbi:MAG: YHYH protein [Actinomycetia bacterium]|nr:YHYH protein [Actinomycetes bacterium]
MKSRLITRNRSVVLAACALLAVASCSDDKSDATPTTSAATAVTTASTASTVAGSPDTTANTGVSATTNDCDSIIATFRAVESANPDLADPSLVLSCDGDDVVVQTNSMPDYLYIEASPGDPEASDLTFRIPLVPVVAATPGEIPALGASAVAINGVAIYGPTEATGGDVLSLPSGALSACGSHNGPTGFHMHLFLWAAGVDCLFDADVVESNSAGQVGWSLDGYPIMSGFTCVDAACSSVRQLVSSWQLTDDSLFASDTWNAHSYVEGSGDLDQCNGRVDSDGQYRYYTTPTFPYFMGCYHGEVAADAGGGLGSMGGPP